MTSGTLVLFDFDGTITRKDTLFEIIKFHHGHGRFLLGMIVLSPVFLLTAVGLFSRSKAKELLLGFFFKSLPLPEFQRICEDFSMHHLPGITRTSALRKLKQHQNRGDRVVVVSASPENWIGKWAQSENLEVIATRLKVNERGEITGRIKGLNCNGGEKVARITKYLDLSSFDQVIAYGDSKGDLPMLNLAHKAYYRAFRE